MIFKASQGPGRNSKQAVSRVNNYCNENMKKFEEEEKCKPYAPSWDSERIQRKLDSLKLIWTGCFMNGENLTREMIKKSLALGEV